MKLHEHEASIPVKTFAFLNGNSINHGFFVGDADTPVSDDTTFEQMVEEFFGMYTVPGKDGDVIPLDSFQEVVDQFDALVAAADHFKARLLKAKVFDFDRDAWIEANDGKFDHKYFDDFIKDIQL